jgi:CHAT domain-containing protein
VDANGKEVEGFGVLAQRGGAGAVLASLWPVADSSTSELMRTFYANREARQSKAEALRQAQLTLLQGSTGVPGGVRGFDPAREPGEAPPFTPDPRAPYAHPYYWAPFILIGNWR